jgi:predicted N-acyltransferase
MLTKLSSLQQRYLRLEAGRHVRCLERVGEHRIDVNEGSKSIKQRLRRFSPDKKKAIKKEITKLMVVGLHLDWLANPVLVQKKNTAEWRMCVDYTDLNKHCPKDPFGLP